MSDDLPDWLRDYAASQPQASGLPPLERVSVPPSSSARLGYSGGDGHHLRVLRRLLAQDYLQRADWDFALADLARMARDGLNAARAMVATLDADSGQWRAVTDAGAELDAVAISNQASSEVLAQLTAAQAPILTASARQLDFHSPSMVHHDIESILAVPLFWRTLDASETSPRLGGCIYAHRTAQQTPFSDRDIALMEDIARVAQPILNLLLHLRGVEDSLARHKQALRDLSVLSVGERLGQLETQDPHFATSVIGPLRLVSKADKVGLMILGPSGAGKTHLARAFHLECPRHDGPFITLDCSQITSLTTLNAELFGYARHSGYANAPPQGRLGKASLADGGTLFIDEVGCLPAELQQPLLRLVQEGRFSPLGASQEQQVDIQVIVATNVDLAALVQAGRFREDLYWRLKEFTVWMPPLSQRRADIPALAHRFLEQATVRFNRRDVKDFAPDALDHLVHHDWSQNGNIRGLEHAIRRAVLLTPPGVGQLHAAALHLREIALSAQPQAPIAPHGAAPFARGPALARPWPPAAAAYPASVASPGQLRQPPLRFGALDRGELHRALSEAMVRCGYNVNAMTRDERLCRFLGRPVGRVSGSTLQLWLNELGLREALRQGRVQGDEALLEQAIDAVRLYGTGTAAARHLGISRDKLIWRLRKAKLTIGQILASSAD